MTQLTGPSKHAATLRSPNRARRGPKTATARAVATLRTLSAALDDFQAGSASPA